MTSKSSSDLGKWLEELSLGKYRKIFEQQSINFDILEELTDEDLQAIAVSMGDRKRLLKAIAGLKQPTGSAPARHLARTAEHARDQRRPELRQLTILFCDLVDSTTLANMLNVEDLADIYRAYRACISASTARWGGHIAQYFGDGALLCFGWPTARENDSERAIRVGLDIVATVGRTQAHAVGVRLAARVGIATGMTMIGGLTGGGFAQEESVVGPIPNLAARLQSLADPGTVLIASSTYRLVSEIFECVPRGRVSLKGFSEDIEVWQPRRTVEIARFQTRLSQRLAPLAGREREMEVLCNLWKEAASGSGRGIVIAGDAGIGKSRLVHGLRESLVHVPYAELHWQCSPFHVDSAFRPVAQAMQGHAAIAADDPFDVRQQAEALLAALGGDEDHPATARTGQLHEVVELVARFAFRLADPGPLLMVVEDVHWADPSTLAAIDRILAEVETRNLLLILTCRCETGTATQKDWPGATHIDLESLSVASARSMVCQIAGGLDLSEDFLGSIIATTGGVPLYIEEMTRMLLASGQLHGSREHAAFGESGVSLAVPATLRELLAARLDTLGADKPIAQIAATVGRPFSPTLLGYLVGEPKRIQGALARLCEAGILECQRTGPDPAYAFRHGLLQKAAYQSQLRQRLRELHAQIAKALEDHFPDDVQSGPDFLAYHLIKAEMPEPAARYFLAAGQNALRLAATREALANFDKGLAALLKLPRSTSREQLELRLQASLGTALMMSKSWAAAEAEAALGAANALAHASTDPHEAIWVLWGVFVYNQVRGNVFEAAEVADKIRAATQPSHVVSLLVAEMVSIQVSFYAGRFGDALAHCAGLALHFDAPTHRPLVSFYTIDLELVAKVHQAIAEWILGRPGQAAALSQEADDLARSIGHLYSVAWMLTWGSMVHLLSNDHDALKKRLDEGIAISDLHGFSYMGALGRMMRGWSIGCGGCLNEGIAEMQDGIDAFTATGAEIAIPYFRVLRAELLDCAGRKSEAMGQLADAEAQVKARGERWAEAELHRVRGDILAREQGADHRHARSSYRRALAVSREQGARGWRCRVRASLISVSSSRRGDLSLE